MPSNLLTRSSLSGLPDEIGVLAAIDAVPFPIVILDHKGAVLRANDPFRASWVFSKRLPASFDEFLDETDRLVLKVLLERLRQTGGRETAQFRLLLGDDFVKWALADFTAQKASDRNPFLIAVHLADITAQKKLEQDLAERESRWNNALVSSVSGVWDHNYVTDQKYYSQTWRDIRGMSPDDPLAETTEDWLTLVHPDDREAVVHAIERQNAGDPAYAVFEYRELHKAGHWIWIECRGAGVEWDANGKPTRVVGTDTDISARKATEEAMAKISRRLEMAMEISGVGVFEADFNTGEVEWDERMLSIYQIQGHHKVEVGGLWESFLHPEDAERVLQTVAHHVKNGLRFSDQYRVLLRDGTERVIRTRTMPFIDGAGHQRMVGANWDVTSDVVLHRELERAKMLAEARNRELETARIRIEHNAMHDYLTGLPNRRYLDEMLDRITEDTSNGTGIALLHVDLDRFKQINDTLGHGAGDMMLKHAARILKESIRKDDFVARIGGDEFVILSRFEGPVRKLSKLAERIIRELSKPVSYESHHCRFGASIGIACETGGNVDGRQLLLNADIALYRAKHLGRNRCEFFSADEHNKIISTRRLADDILLGLERFEFFPFYQLQFEAATLDIAGVETLARWMHPEQGMLTPDKFLPAAEELDVVARLDAMILDKALTDYRNWKQIGFTIPKLSVNVSYRRLHDPSLAKKLKKLNIEPGTVSFELLESIFLDDQDDGAMHTLAKLRKLGIDIEIDDFGTGHASIVSLLRLSPRALKIDRELIRPLTQSAEQRRLVGSIIEIGKSLHVKVVAEGVETTDHIRILRDLGCDLLQGYALARPMPGPGILDFIRADRWRLDTPPRSVKS